MVAHRAEPVVGLPAVEDRDVRAARLQPLVDMGLLQRRQPPRVTERRRQEGDVVGVDLARCAAGASPRYFPSESGRLGSLASRLDRRALLEFEQWLTSLGRLVSHPLNARLLAEDAFTRYRSLLAAG